MSDVVRIQGEMIQSFLSRETLDRLVSFARKAFRPSPSMQGSSSAFRKIIPPSYGERDADAAAARATPWVDLEPRRWGSAVPMVPKSTAGRWSSTVQMDAPTIPKVAALVTSSQPAGPDRAPQRSGARILLADDLDLNRRLIADMLSFEGHEIDCVGDGLAAVAAAASVAYDLILMDMIMPIMDGLEATRTIRRLPSPHGNVPIVALTANAFREHLDACLAAGMDVTLTKPMSMDALARAVDRWRRAGAAVA